MSIEVALLQMSLWKLLAFAALHIEIRVSVTCSVTYFIFGFFQCENIVAVSCVCCPVASELAEPLYSTHGPVIHLTGR
jgi:hypothetical protein